MKIYSHYGFKDFVLCLGRNGNVVTDYFKLTHAGENENWNIVFADTGLETQTGGRIKLIEKYINEDNFFVTYGDGLANVDIKKLLEFHQSHKKIATLTAIKTYSPFGMLKIESNHVREFKEKPLLDYYINGGFFVFKKDTFDYIENNNDVLEREVFDRITRDGELCAFKHYGFWRCVDTFKDLIQVNKIWKTNPRWKVWED
jgi:glucose-1-phosphate cytidylyltransferase